MGSFGKLVTLLGAVAGLLACTTNSVLSNVDLGGSTLAVSSATAMANGTDTIACAVTLRRKNGSPVPGVGVTLVAEGCLIHQPVAASDSQGRITASLSSSRVGDRQISVLATFDGQTSEVPAAQATVTFQGQSVAPGAVSSLAVPVSDANGNVDASYTGTVHFTSSDPLATLPPDYTFLPGDKGEKVFAGAIVLRTPGVQTVTATDVASGRVISVQSFVVQPQPLAGFKLDVVDTLTAGQTVQVRAAALASDGTVFTAYTGTVHVSSSDAHATLPADITLTAAAAGVAQFSVALTRAGVQSVTLTDTVTGASGSVSTTVVAGVTTALHVTAATSVTAGTSTGVAVSAVDAHGNVGAGYSGAVTLVSTDPQASGVPSTYTFTAADRGSHAFGSVVFGTAGTQTLSASDGQLQGDAPVAVGAGAITHLAVSGAVGGTAPVVTAVAVAAADAFGNAVPTYAGTVQLTSSDAGATLPAAYSFVSEDHGSHVFSIVLPTAGVQTVTARDAAANRQAAQTGIAVTPGAATHLNVVCNNAQVAGTAATLSITALDSVNNAASGYRGAVEVVSTDVQSTMPATHTFVSADSGTYTFVAGVIFRTAGTQVVFATDADDGSVYGIRTAISVAAGNANNLRVTGLTGRQAGVPQPVTVTAYDAFNNQAPAYTGKIHFTTTAPAASLPADYSFTGSGGDAGAHTFANAVNVTSAGSWTVTARDINSGGPQGVSSSFVVSAAAANTLSVSGIPATLGVEENANVIVGATDVYGNGATSYLGTVHFSSSDTNATVPADYSFTAADQGAHVFAGQLRFGTIGTERVTATDTQQSITGMQSGIVTTGYTILQIATAPIAQDTCVLLSNHRVKCWGSNAGGGLGYGDPISRGGTPQTMGFYLPFVNLGAGVTATSVQASGFVDATAWSCALLTGGQVKCWGGAVFQVGAGGAAGSDPNTLPNVNLGTGRTALAVSLGSHDTCALLDTHQVTCWGLNPNGELGLGDTQARSSPAATPINLGAGRTAKAISAGDLTTCAVLDTGNATCWGGNAIGQLGLGDTTDRYDPSVLPPINLGAGRTALSVSAGGQFSCAILDTNAVKCWGLNGGGELGMGDTTQRTTPATNPINFGAGRTALSLSTGTDNSCALLDNHQVACWGDNSVGEMGTGNTSNQLTPVVVNLGTGRTAQAVTVGDYFACALLDNNTVTCWGNNAAGQLGYSDTTNRGDTPSNTPNLLGSVPLW